MRPNRKDSSSGRSRGDSAVRRAGQRRVAVVVAGAGARGAYEAGALSVLIPWLCEQESKPSIFVGTSAGTINATLFAAVADRDPAEGAELVLDAWRSLSLGKVFRSPVTSVPLKTAPAYARQVLGLGHVVSLLDAGPLADTADEILSPFMPALRDNIHGEAPTVETLAVVATDDLDRTAVFVDTRDDGKLPPSDPGRAIHYEPAEISPKHVLASSAIPALFPPVKLGAHWYTDGGVRLNVPLKLAIALGATELAVVATHPATYPDVDASAPRRRDVVDGVVTVLESVLADRMVEDILTLGSMNEAVHASAKGLSRNAVHGREISYIFVGPESRHQLGKRAEAVYRKRFSGADALQEPHLALLRRLIGPDEQGVGDLLSYLFFDQAFIDDAIKLAIQHATKVTNARAPWTTGVARG
jgi:NTE family protein